MFETSEDLLNIVKAVCLVGFTIFACIGLYYFAMLLRQVFKIIKEMRDRINRIDKAIEDIKKKYTRGKAILLASELVKKGLDVAKDYSKKVNKIKKTKK